MTFSPAEPRPAQPTQVTRYRGFTDGGSRGLVGPFRALANCALLLSS